MSGEPRARKAASVRAKLLGLSSKEGIAFDHLAHRYAVERLLARLQASPHREAFILKGAMLFPVWGLSALRPTRDLDLMGLVAPDQKGVARLIAEVASVPVAEDGLAFPADRIAAEAIRGQARYPGVRIRMLGILGTMRIAMRIDIGTGDSLVPPPIRVSFPALLDGDPPEVLGYCRELVVAEKFEAMVALGGANSRMKDFFDIWALSANFEFEEAPLREAIGETFRRRGTPMPSGKPTALSEQFASEKSKMAQWNAFASKTALAGTDPRLHEVCLFVWEFLGPILEPGADGMRTWRPGKGWA